MGVFYVLMFFLCGILYPVFNNKWRGTRLEPVPASQGGSSGSSYVDFGLELGKGLKFEMATQWGLFLFLPVGIIEGAQVGGMI